MGFFISKPKSTKLNEYIGAQTIYSCAERGAFDCTVSKDLEEYSSANENIMAIVGASGVKDFLKILKSGECIGRDVGKFANIVEEYYKQGFMVSN